MTRRLTSASHAAVAAACAFTVAATAALVPASALATPVADWQIIEGYGLTDGFAYLGMTRAEAESRLATGASGSCYDSFGFHRCDLWADGGAPEVRVVFATEGADAVATQIQIFPIYGAYPWPTTRGATGDMPLPAVRQLYPDSVTHRDRSPGRDSWTRDRTLVSASAGYAHQVHRWCLQEEDYTICDGWVTQVVFPVGGQLATGSLTAPDARPSTTARSPVAR